MKTNVLFVRSFILTALLFVGVSWAAVGQTTATMGIRLTGSTYNVFLTPTSTGTTDLTDATQVVITVPTGGSFNIANLTSAIPGVTWSLGAPKDTYQGKDYFIIVMSAVAGNQTFTAGQEKPLFSFSNTGTCTGEVGISTFTTFTPLPGGGDASMYLAFTNNGGGANNGFTGTVSETAPCQALAVTGAVSGSTAFGTPLNGNVSTDANPQGGTGTYTYASVACNGATPSPTAPPASSTTQQNGQITVNSTTGAYTYTPATNFTGTDQFCIRVCSGNDCQVVSYTITVGTAPVPALSVSPTTSITATAGTPKSGNVPTEANVTGGSNNKTYTWVQCSGATPSPTSPAAATTTQQGGSVTMNSTTGAYTYTSAPNFVGTDTFCVRICSGNDCQVSTYTATVSSNCPQFTLPTLSK